jgi:uncharacterized protein
MARNGLVFAAALATAFAIAPNADAATPPRPPDGTYVYQTTVSGIVLINDDVVITAQGTTIAVHDASTLPVRGITVLTTASFNAATLTQNAYSADAAMAAGKQHTDATFAPGSITLSVSGQTPVTLKALPSAPLEILGDNLGDSLVLIVAELHALRAQQFTLAVTEGGVTLPAHIDWNASAPRPAGVPATDAAATLTAGPVEETLWYDPATFTVDDAVVPSQNVEIKLVSRRLGVVTAATPQPLAMAVPTPFPHFTSTDVTFTSADGTKLAGTVTVPDRARGRLPAIVLVHGSGAMDRNETIGPNPVFLQLSNALSNAGYVVLRYDKRGIGKSGGNAATTTRDDLLQDVRASIAFARTLRSVDARRIYLLGHSEGGELVPTVAAGNPMVAGIILMAPPALPLRQISLQQVLAMNPPSGRATARREELAALQNIRSGKTTGPGMVWYRSSMDVDPAVEIARVHVPILILQGGSDVQVLPADLPRLVRAARAHNRDVTARVFPGDNHLFMKVTPGEPLTPQAAVHQYLTVPARIDPAVLHALIAWLNARAL